MIECDPGFFCENGIAKECSPGTLATDPGLTECGECPIGANCIDPANPYQCADGTHPDETKTICERCSVGYFCKNGVSETCPPGTSATDPGLDECLQCPNGMNCADPIRPEYCPAGQYPNDSQTSCLDCQPGNYCVNEVFLCQVGRNCSQYGLASVSLRITLISLKNDFSGKRLQKRFSML